MKEVSGDLWDTSVTLGADAVAITTNGYVKKNGEAVMGRGVAREAARRWPVLPRLLGDVLRFIDNCVFKLYQPPDFPILVSYPVKHNWWEPADMRLIRSSAKDLRDMADEMKWTVVVLPRPGCGNGRLDWKDVRPVLAPYLDDRFVVVYKEDK